MYGHLKKWKIPGNKITEIPRKRDVKGGTAWPSL